MATSTFPNPPSSPLTIGSRGMVAVTLPDASTIHIQPRGRDDEDRVIWRYIIDGADGADGATLDDAADIRTGVDDHVDHRRAMVAILRYLGAASDAYHCAMHDRRSENADLFPPPVTEWAYLNDSELAALALEIEETPARSGEVSDLVWWDIWNQSGCADCAANACQAKPWGPAHCWATHRPHTSPEP